MYIHDKIGLDVATIQQNVKDPFHLDIQVTDLRIQHNSTAPVTSHFMCTPGCGRTGTGNSFCCTCR